MSLTIAWTRLCRALPWLLMATITVLSHQSRLPGGVSVPPPWDKVVHGSVFLVLGVLLRLGWGGRLGPWALTGIAVGFGVLDEWHQSHIPGRDPSPGDVAADAIGGAVGVWLAGAPWRRNASRETP